ncbi:MAG: acyl carrier protein [Candidatus Zixiibacteriota bacterium]|nr:MAG: acyl carrier protein [candidate division Zixibacteria bacterium]
MAENDTTRKKLKDFIVATFMVGDENLSDSESFMQSGIIDSTGVLELASFVEQEFSITIEDDEMTPSNLDSIDNLVNFVSRKTG